MSRSALAFRMAALVVLVAGAGVAVTAAVAACTSFDEAALPGVDAATDGPGPGEGGAAVVDAGACAIGAFCDSFDDEAPLPRAWSTVQLRGAGQVAVVKDAGIDGSSALVVTLVADKVDQAGYLDIRRGQNGPESYTVVLSFAARVSTVGTGFLLGPRFNADEGASLGEHDIIVDFHDGKTRLDHYTPTCDGGCALNNKDTPFNDGWHHYVLTLGVRPFNGIDYGDIRYEADGLVLISDKLPFSMSSPKTYGFQVGVTYSSGNASGTVAFDDVSLEVRP